MFIFLLHAHSVPGLNIQLNAKHEYVIKTFIFIHAYSLYGLVTQWNYRRQ